ncbi:TylF/MycF/NovP-related O-methyltransferase [Paraliobacillus sp. JSM ZJ581]|uniref:TylF/MycF/NovP-related O-methyltransferase n=1 Tax=Paraliobacillus sp. JSM ZJ581 TaxID=3342118 RepID=UPI0035A8F0D5
MINKYLFENAFDYENGFILTSEPYRIGNILSHYELYKKIINLPGNVIELGVFKGNSLVQFATFRELLENEKSRQIIGFDMFGEFPSVNEVKSDMAFVDKWNKQFNDSYITKKELELSFQHKRISNIQLVEGNIMDTLPSYIKEKPQEKIALLHIDCDVYEPSALALELLFDRVVKGGVIVFDDYGTVEGETRAVDEFFEKHHYSIKKFSFSHTKPSYIVK